MFANGEGDMVKKPFVFSKTARLNVFLVDNSEDFLSVFTNVVWTEVFSLQSSEVQMDTKHE